MSNHYELSEQIKLDSTRDYIESLSEGVTNLSYVVNRLYTAALIFDEEAKANNVSSMLIVYNPKLFLKKSAEIIQVLETIPKNYEFAKKYDIPRMKKGLDVLKTGSIPLYRGV